MGAEHGAPCAGHSSEPRGRCSPPSNGQSFAASPQNVRTSSAFIVIAQLTKSALTVTAALAFHSVRAMIWAAAIQGMLQILFMLAYIHRRFGRFGKRPWRIRDAFGTAALSPGQLAILLPFPFIVWGADELRRYWLRRGV